MGSFGGDKNNDIMEFFLGMWKDFYNTKGLRKDEEIFKSHSVFTLLQFIVLHLILFMLPINSSLINVHKNMIYSVRHEIHYIVHLRKNMTNERTNMIVAAFPWYFSMLRYWNSSFYLSVYLHFLFYFFW